MLCKEHRLGAEQRGQRLQAHGVRGRGSLVALLGDLRGRGRDLLDRLLHHGLHHTVDCRGRQHHSAAVSLHGSRRAERRARGVPTGCTMRCTDTCWMGTACRCTRCRIGSVPGQCVGSRRLEAQRSGLRIKVSVSSLRCVWQARENATVRRRGVTVPWSTRSRVPRSSGRWS